MASIFIGFMANTDCLLFLRARSLAVSSKGKYLYVSARGEDAGVSVFSRDQQSGEHPNYTIRQLALFTRDTLTGQVTFAPDERFFYVADLSGVATFSTGHHGQHDHAHPWQWHLDRSSL
jgi:hypothetical protein